MGDAGSESQAGRGLHVVAKPIGPVCNLACEYCFYVEKRALFGAGEPYRMSDDVLAAFVESYVASQPTPVVEFVWQGGEPTLLGVDFFRRVIELQRPFARRKTIVNALQTNGTLLDDAWCEFLARHRFVVGLSLDGPKDVHDRYRRDRQGNGTFDRVLRGLRLLQRHGVEYNVLACVARDTAARPLEVYRFLRDQGVEFIQFTPIVERVADARSAALGLSLAGPAALDGAAPAAEVTPWTVVPEQYGDFLVAVYEEWVRRDVGRVFVMNFEWALNAWIRNPSPVCVHAETCGRSVVLEHDGSVYACDHCVYPEYALGDVSSATLAELVDAPRQREFGALKDRALPSRCRRCPVLPACRGGCPKHRFARTAGGDPGLHYLCAGYERFFLHIRKYLRVMATLLEHGLPASYVMEAVKGPLALELRST